MYLTLEITYLIINAEITPRREIVPMRRLLAAVALSASALLPLPVLAADARPLVDVAWLKQSLEQPNLVVLDIRSDSEGGGEAGFARGHIQGAVFSDYAKAGWRTTLQGVPGMLPPVNQVAALIGSLGIDNKTHVVVVPAGKDSTDFGSAARVYWTFKVLGHDAVSILDGGYTAWTAQAAPVAIGPVAKPTPKSFTPNFRAELLATTADVSAALVSKIPLIDARPVDQYTGKVKAPVAKAPGTIPGAVNLPNTSFTATNPATMLPSEHLRALLAKAGVPEKGPQIAFCNTGHWAAVAWFGLSEVLGNPQVKLYDGSMAEWTADASRPLDIKAVIATQ